MAGRSALLTHSVASLASTLSPSVTLRTGSCHLSPATLSFPAALALTSLRLRPAPQSLSLHPSRGHSQRSSVGAIGSSGSKGASAAADMGALQKAQALVSGHAVVVFSKTYCPYCTRVKQLLRSLGVKFELVELDTERDGNDVQSALASWTGQRTVPSVFIAGKHIGGCDDTTALHSKGQLVPMLQAAGAV